MGTLKGVGRIYQQTFIDTYTKVAHVKLYAAEGTRSVRKNALVAADALNDKVIPWFEAQGVPLLRILTDRGSEYCGNVEHHEYELYLAVENIDHARTKAKSPQTNGICERFHRTMLDEFYRVAFRKKLYTSIEELQQDADEWIVEYNCGREACLRHRTHSGKYCFGKTPMQTFIDSKHLALDKIIELQFEKEEKEETKTTTTRQLFAVS